MIIKKILLTSIFLCLIPLNGTSEDIDRISEENIKYFDIKPIPGHKTFNTPPCVFWEYNIKNAEQIWIYFKSGERDIMIFEKKIKTSIHSIFNSLKDRGITHCPFNHKNRDIKTAVYFYKIKIRNKAGFITRTFVINKEK